MAVNCKNNAIACNSTLKCALIIIIIIIIIINNYYKVFSVFGQVPPEFSFRCISNNHNLACCRIDYFL